MNEQVQCPNCGGYKVGIEFKKPIFEDTESNKKSRKLAARIWLWFFGPLLTCAVISSFTGRLELGAILGGISVVLSFVFIFWAVKHGVGREIAKQYWYLCYLCGYKWIWRTDRPLAKANIRPDLTTKGEQRHERERRRSEEEYRHAGMWMKKR